MKLKKFTNFIFEKFEKYDNISQEDIIDTIKNDGIIYVSYIYDKKHDENIAVKPVSIDDDLIIVNIDNNLYKTRLDRVKMIEYNKL